MDSVSPSAAEPATTGAATEAPKSFPVVESPPIGLTPSQTISTPEHLDWHMIQDHELTQLSNVEGGVISSLAFVGIGGALGLVGPFLAALDKVKAVPPQATTAAELFYLVGFSGTVVLGIGCLAIHLLSLRRKKSLADLIRARPKQGMPTGDRRA